jgi:uncharacterized delta-60 repeat protein
VLATLCLSALVAMLVAAPLAAGATKGNAGRLDRGFSKDGKVVTAFPQAPSTRVEPNYRLPFEFAQGRIAMAPAGGGKLVVANSTAIVHYLANGRRNPGFGGNGAVPIGPIEGSRFQIADVAVDSRGRVVVAGTTRPASQVGMPGPDVVGPLPSRVTLRRYLANGQIDGSFGSEGVLHTHLGAAAPTFAGYRYAEPAVGAVGLAVDAANRPIVTGSAVVQIGRCEPSQNRYEASQGIVARLNEDGSLDGSFAGGGVRTVGGLSWLGPPALRNGGLVAVGAEVDPCPRGGPDNPSLLVSLGGDGSIDGGFATAGFWSRPFTRISDVAAMPSGKIVLLARTIELSGGEWVESTGMAIRLRANGAVDRGFGRGGRADLALPKDGSVAAITTDAKGRVLLAGSVPVEPRGEKAKRSSHNSAQLSFLLLRLDAKGERDSDFGRKGRVATAFGANASVHASDVLVDPAGRIVVGGPFSGPNVDAAFAIARYLATGAPRKAGRPGGKRGRR